MYFLVSGPHVAYCCPRFNADGPEFQENVVATTFEEASEDDLPVFPELDLHAASFGEVEEALKEHIWKLWGASCMRCEVTRILKYTNPRPQFMRGKVTTQL